MKQFLLFLLLLLSNFINAQSTSGLTIKESAEYSDEVRTDDISTIHTFENKETTVVRSGRKVFLFDVFDHDLNKVFTQEIKVSKNEKYVGDLAFKNQLKFFTVDAPTTRSRILYCYTFDLTTKTIQKTTIFETTIENDVSLFGSRKNHQTSFALSPNKNYFAIATDDITKSRNAYTIRVYDAKTEAQIFTKSYQESEDKFYQNNDLYIDDEANVYALGKLFLKGTKDKATNGEANYQFVLNKISKNDNSNLTIDLENEHILSMRFSKSENKMHLIGFFSEQKAVNIKGGCNFEVDLNKMSLLTKKTHLLPLEVYEDLYGEKRGERKKEKNKELKKFYLDHVLNDSEGNTYLIAEEFYVTYQQVGFGTPVTYYETIDHYDDIIVLKFNKIGDLVWGRSIFKKAYGPSYNAFIKANTLHIILNSGKNLVEKSDGRTKVSQGVFEGVALYDIEFSETGEVAYHKIIEYSNLDVFLPFYGTFEANRFIMMNYSKKRKVFMILD
jgi:WD40 repeat protein